MRSARPSAPNDIALYRGRFGRDKGGRLVEDAAIVIEGREEIKKKREKEIKSLYKLNALLAQ
ncbi:hypothetical protein FG05_35155 [Fusarium graminearum]|nr:hypothetical protein FG05_35155 [Fusarium graminearum]